jgi:hypothetical protein
MLCEQVREDAKIWEKRHDNVLKGSFTNRQDKVGRKSHGQMYLTSSRDGIPRRGGGIDQHMKLVRWTR